MAVEDLRRVYWRLALLTLLPLCVLTWLGVRMLAGERDAERQRHADRLRLAADRVALDIQRSLQDIEESQVTSRRVQLVREGPRPVDEQALLYGPSIAAQAWWEEPALEDAERLEFQGASPGAAVRAYRAAALTQDPPVRAQALVALARVLRRQHADTEALAAYDALEQMGDTVVAGQPAALLAYRARLRLHVDARDRARAREASDAFARALYAGRWRIDRVSFEDARDAIVAADGPVPPAVPLARTRAALMLWEEWLRGELKPRGRRLLDDPDAPTLAVWGGDLTRPVAWLGSIDDVRATWEPILARQGVSLSVYTTEGRHLFGSRERGGIALTPADTGVPLVLHVTPLHDPGDPTTRSRRLALAGVLGGAFLLLVAVGWSISRTTHRELSLARQQKDFVSAVSHEFRTPLTSMRHLLDLLSTRPVTEERRSHYYGLLTQETERLHRMVESLLTFGRLEAGAHGWRMQPIDLSDLLHSLLEVFEREPLARGRAVACEVSEDAARLSGDPEAVTRALWNLLENAAKYSAPGTPIALTAVRDGSRIRIAIADHGVGVDAADRERIFGKFQRSSAAVTGGVPGVGIGLALVRLIAEGHGGTVDVDSTPGQGSRFTLVLPVGDGGAT